MSLFFILSGFVLAHRYGRNEIDLKKYALARFARIYPVYFLSLILALPIFFQSTLFERLSFGHVVEISLIVIFALGLMQAWAPYMFQIWTNSGSWSLSVEFFFYALFPLMLKNLKKWNNRQLLLTALALYLFSALLGMGLRYAIENEGARTLYSVPIYRLPEFVIGMILGILYSRELLHRRWVIYGMLSIATLLLFVVLAFIRKWNYVTLGWLSIPTIAIIIYSLAFIEREWPLPVPGRTLLIYAGRASYSFYLIQIVTLEMIGPGLLIHFQFTPWEMFGILLVVNLALSSLVYSFFEEPMRRLISRRALSAEVQRAVI